jgi:hypothetical protein
MTVFWLNDHISPVTFFINVDLQMIFVFLENEMILLRLKLIVIVKVNITFFDFVDTLFFTDPLNYNSFNFHEFVMQVSEFNLIRIVC